MDIFFLMIQRQTSDKPHETTASECNDEYAWIQQTEKCKNKINPQRICLNN